MWDTVLAFDQVIVKTATISTLIMAANLTQILNLKPDFHKEIELLKIIFECPHNARHCKVVSTLKNI